jgi:N-methylhydantoinase A
MDVYGRRQASLQRMLLILDLTVWRSEYRAAGSTDHSKGGRMERQKGIFSNKRYRVGVDIGGTFTDIVFLSREGDVFRKKVSSTPHDYNRAIIRGIQEVLDENGLTGENIAEVVHGCTVATNAILEHTGARTGLITTQGFRDVLEIRRFRMPEMYNVAWMKPLPLSPRELRREVNERVNYKGEIIHPLDLSEVEAVVDLLVRKGVESIAVCLINSYVNPLHERKIKEVIQGKYPGLSVSISSDLIPVIKEYERTSEAVVNAYIKPVVSTYLYALQETLRTIGVKAPLLIMQSSGGMMSVATSTEKPIYMIECGPAAGVVGSHFIAKKLGIPNAITLDMGGTTTKASIIEEGQITMSSAYEVGAGISMASRLTAGGGYVIRVPSIDIAEISAGGGSKLWMDIGGVIHAGPRSAGAVPGPVCYDTGGTDPTITDVNLILGYLPDELAGGVKLKKEKALEALTQKIAAPLHMGVTEAAFGAYMIANSNMIRAIRAVSTLRGRDTRDFTLLAYGGAGPLHAAALAKELEISKVIIPPAAGVFSSFGLLFAQIEHHASESFFHRLDASVVDTANEAWKRMREKVIREIEAADYGKEITLSISKLIDVRYAGQSSEMTLPVAWETIHQEHIPQLIGSFNKEHLRTYAHHRADEPVDVVNLKLLATVTFPAEVEPDHLVSSEIHAARTGRTKTRKAYFGKEKGWMDTTVLSLSDLTPHPQQGPFVIELYDATCVVPPYATVRIGKWGAIEIEIQH